MQKSVFDELTVLYRAHESRAGCSELCQDASGAKNIRVRIRNPMMQKEILSQLTKRIPARLSSGVLDLLLPWQDGQTLAEWLYASKPNLGQRRDACLSLLADLIAFPTAPSLIALSAETKNLCFTAQQCHLQRLPNLAAWRPGMQTESMIRSVASLIKEILTTDQSKSSRHRFPVEMQLVLLRCDLGSYTSWDSLQQDLAALPDELRPVGWFLQKMRAWLYRIAARYVSTATRVIVILLAVAALLSLTSVYRTWQSEQKKHMARHDGSRRSSAVPRGRRRAMSKLISRLRKHKRAFLYTAAAFLVSLLIGGGASLLQGNEYLPALDGDISTIVVAQDTILCAVSRDQDSLLLRLDTNGTLLNYCRLDSDQVIQKLAVSDQGIYAIMAAYRDGETTQKLISLSQKEKSMTPQTILDLSALPEEGAAGIAWQSLTIPDDGNILLGGKDSQGNGYSLSLALETGSYQIDKTLQGGNILFLSQPNRHQILWVSNTGQVHLSQNGQKKWNLLSGQSQTPQQPFFCGEYGFLSDSITGDIYKLDADGSAWLFRKGSDAISYSNHTYEQYSAFTVYPDDDGNLRVAGVCSSDGGVVIVGEEWSIDTMRLGRHRLLLFWQHGWPIALAALVLLLFAGLWMGRILHSPRLSTRLTLCELLAAVVLLAAVTIIQYRAYQTTLLEEANQTLHLVGSSLALSLESDTRMTDQTLRDTVRQTHDQVYAVLTKDGKTYTLRVIWQTPDGPAIGYDDTMPAGYLLEDVETRNYLSAVNAAFHSDGGGIQMLRGEISTNYLYIQTFRQGDQYGCVTVSLPREILFRGQAQFFQRMLPILAACPLLFLSLLWITRWFLAPLNTIRDALEEFYASGGGNQMVLTGMPRTELYEVGRVFNQLSLETKTQFNALMTMNDAYRKLVPNSILHILGKSNVSELAAGDTVTMDAALLVLAPSEPDDENSQIMTLINYAAEAIGAFGGIVVDHDEGLDSVTALFSDTQTALACARTFMTDQKSVIAAVLQESIVFGVFGGTHLLYPLALTPYMARRFDAIALMRRFGAKIIRCGSYAAGLRLLGWDDGLTFYEETVWRSPDWQSVWQNVDALWAQALELYRQHKFSAAMRKFAGILRAMPGDEAAHWYLFRCEAFRDAKQEKINIDLLYGWGDKP